MINFNVSEMPVLGLLVMILLVVLIAVFVGPGRLARNVVLGERTPPDFVVVIGRGRSTDRPRVEEGGGSLMSDYAGRLLRNLSRRSTGARCWCCPAF
jgi:hypothetical protein